MDIVKARLTQTCDEGEAAITRFVERTSQEDLLAILDTFAEGAKTGKPTDVLMALCASHALLAAIKATGKFDS